MALYEIDPAFGFGGANITPGGASGVSVGEVLAASREDVFFPRFDWSTLTQAAASDLASLVALVNVISAQMFLLAPIGARLFGVRNVAPSDDAAGVLELMISQVNGLKAALVATASVDYSALTDTPDATDLATAQTLANAIQTALGVATP